MLSDDLSFLIRIKLVMQELFFLHLFFGVIPNTFTHSIVILPQAGSLQSFILSSTLLKLKPIHYFGSPVILT